MNINPGIIIATMFVAVVVFLIVLIFADDSTQEACADIGGEYVVVGEEYSAAAKRTVDIYGCTKYDGGEVAE